MRDPGRIRPFLEMIATAWELSGSDQRFGQFVMNVSRDRKTGEFQDTWNWENSRWREAIERYLDVPLT